MRYGQADLQRAYTNIHILYIYIYIYSPREGTGYTFQYSCLDSSIPPWIEEYIYTDIGHAAQYAR